MGRRRCSAQGNHGHGLVRGVIGDHQVFEHPRDPVKDKIHQPDLIGGIRPDQRLAIYRRDLLAPTPYPAAAPGLRAAPRALGSSGFRARKNPRSSRYGGLSFFRSLAVSYSHMAIATLSSALCRFTSVFGMGTGGSNTLWPPGKLADESRPCGLASSNWVCSQSCDAMLSMPSVH